MRLAMSFSKDSPAPTDFEDRLHWLCRFGKPRVSFMGDSWYAEIDMNTTAKGTAFKVESDFGHATPSGAVAQIIERMLKALSDLGVKP